ncbi:S-DNA-T family DNA segregation ATPase FtsK/SpoIIIE [Dysgonomonas sp. PFB1-18]|uniref:FtsK/SpoIIIE family DNA translocase n=1 Tax=unclassified Dysgonomonas TaxID=2630389 RepID=UPI0024747E43|nr:MULTISPECIES: DNA translocase FtsK [unclassified Dysgonomonas]MDH6307341.1 S-DNA-T family DNA segregation ATPase FtsK/SpoIIIE [Dysgonomonas sp. PF1-14]MDH6337259.1 S-DNA-T family DNA segregation ATPase FtsK/SpoIIIE [Dysgonomonas sp. PF1-16]MDH6379183.1 S-DNA-T family DNA segregation ATPase FtsK/SpoIIIE [Dysgonomonas sp. PFB1-18]MDH6396179.1 S-DNA-T family DNA segregation ATPase FtsK/SpoIIIE [Dysgonomonas sp. PF1-23]
MAKKTVQKKKPQNNKATSFIEIIKKERTKFLLGVCLAFIGAYILLGEISFFVTGAADQSKVEFISFFDLISKKQQISNWTGVLGAFIAERLINKWFGIFSLLIPVYFILMGLKLMRVINISAIRTFLLTAFAMIWGSITCAFISRLANDGSSVFWGGGHGMGIEKFLEAALGKSGTVMVILLLLIIFLIITKKASMEFFRGLFRNPLKRNSETESDPELDNLYEDEQGEPEKESKSIFSFFKKKEKPEDVAEEDDYITEPIELSVKTPKPLKEPKPTSMQVDQDFEIVVPKDEEFIQPVSKNGFSPGNNNITPIEGLEDDILDEGEEMEEYDPTKDLSNFHFPSAELLKVYDTTGKGVDMEEQNANKSRIITTLQNYGIEITSIKATVGPTITLYEIVPKAGVRISKIKNLEDDIALSLSALGIRIIAPMPGKGTIGIEVPNKDPQIVSMQSVIASRKFQESTFDLPVALGKTITNEIFMFDLCKMPHLLVAGATGQGKSVGLNAIITSLLYKKHPAEMKMVLVDPKMVEFNIYSRIEKHYLAKLPDAEKAIITDVSKVTQTLNSLTKEMDDRYELLMNAGVRNIKEYNEKFRKRRLNPLKGHRFLPYLVIIIDEFGDLIMTAGKEIEMPIARIAQKARAVGMHMVIATQRPTTNIITGTIKANFPARMAFRVTSQIDSRTILDMSGANQLIGRGDMLFSQGSDLVRIQCAFVDTPEVEGIAQYIGSQQGYANAFELPEYVGEAGEDKVGSIDLNDRDPLFDEAARLIVVHQQGSTSLIQRKFSIGYNRAGRLMDQLEAAGIVGPTQGSKARDVLIADEYSLEQKLSSFN